jgi:excisionase family DNA binding protein
VEQRFYTAAEVADILRMTPMGVVRLCRMGKLRATKPVRAWLITKADLEAFIADSANGVKPAPTPRRRKARAS